MAKNVTLHYGNNIHTLKNIAKIKTSLSDGSTCYWVPEDSVRLMQKSITSDGVYTAANEPGGYYGYSTVNVAGIGTNVMGDLMDKVVDIDSEGTFHYYAKDDNKYGYSSVTINVNVKNITTTNPETGEDEVTGPSGPNSPNPGSTETVTVPSHIKVEKLPNKTTYNYGETIDYTGIEVFAYLKSMKTWSNADYPKGRIPFNELIFPITVAGEYSGNGGDSGISNTTGGSVYGVDASDIVSETVSAKVDAIYDIVIPYLSEYEGKYPIIMYYGHGVLLFYVYVGIRIGGVINLSYSYNYHSVSFSTSNLTEYCRSDNYSLNLSYRNKSTSSQSNVVFLGVRYPDNVTQNEDAIIKDSGLYQITSSASLKSIIYQFVNYIYNGSGGYYGYTGLAVSSMNGKEVPTSTRTVVFDSGDPINAIATLEFENVSSECEIYPYVASAGFSDNEVDTNIGTVYINNYFYIDVAIVSCLNEGPITCNYTDIYGGQGTRTFSLSKYNDDLYVYAFGNFGTFGPSTSEPWTQNYYILGPSTSGVIPLYDMIYTGGTGRYYDGRIDVSSGGSDPSNPSDDNSNSVDSTDFDQNLMVRWRRPKDHKELVTAFKIHVGNTEEGWMSQ